ncbi:hypothetical protein ASG49_00905 [Marmoricola sp. Leaf446]|uniref:CDP-glycerol glycerophosphotransferase family protein n=1 Tax=Marmoricola sp. Leaf446 TaxID=1736379 RepID=UPI0006FC1403|nr:CDP-glycerol glycerophosphotransferase family protein [Marmoricola sp. Leaf446]KQT93595.1 hypothetical protein ASG49_00905 [Marmoricola sp. Leaf446]
MSPESTLPRRWLGKVQRRGLVARRALRAAHPEVTVVVVLDGEVRAARRALESARAQTHARVEVLAVAADARLLALARTAASDDGRVHVVEAPGCDRARARAFGAVAAQGPWLLFVSPGQVLHREAVARLLAGRQHGPHDAGVVLGGLAGADPADSWARTPLLARLLVEQERWARTLDDAEPAGRTAATALLALGHVVAEGVVVDDVRDQPDWWSSSSDPAAELSARVAQDRASLALLERDDQLRHRRERASGALTDDLPPVLAAAELLDDAGWRLLRSHAAELLAGADLATVPATPRSAAWLAAQDRREDLVALVADRRAAAGHLATEVVDGRVLALLPEAGSLPADARELTVAESGVGARVVGHHVDGQDLVVDLQAGLRRVDEQAPVVRLEAVGAGSVVIGDLPVEVVEDPDVTSWLGEAHQRHDLGAVRTRLPLAALGEAPWELRVEVSDRGVTRTALAQGSVSADARPSAASPVPALSAHEQRRLQDGFAAATASPDPGLLLAVPARSGLTSDAAALAARWTDHAGPGARVLVVVDDPASPVVAGAEAVLRRSPRWYAALAEAGWVVTDHDDVLGTVDTAAGETGDGWYAPRAGQRVVRTTTGGPGPARGLARWRRLGLVPSHVEQLLDRTSRRWTDALASSPGVVRHLVEDWAYDGPVLALGQPRTDALVGPDATRRRDRTRAALDLADGDTAVLWATTCRDDVTGTCLAAAGGPGPDAARVAGLLGPGHVLLRLHDHCGHHDPPRDGARVLDPDDVAGHPVADLVLAADVAVLDFSPLRHDLAVAGRPVVVWAPDLADHVDRQGELFDLPASAAGPTVDSTGAVVAALADVPALRSSWERRRRDLVDHLAPRDDGGAADRVLRALLTDDGGSSA